MSLNKYNHYKSIEINASLNQDLAENVNRILKKETGPHGQLFQDLLQKKSRQIKNVTEDVSLPFARLLQVVFQS